MAALGKLFDFLANIFSPPPPLTPDQQDRQERVEGERAAEHQQDVAASEHSDQLQQQQDIRARLEEQLKADLDHERQRQARRQFDAWPRAMSPPGRGRPPAG